MHTLLAHVEQCDFATFRERGLHFFRRNSLHGSKLGAQLFGRRRAMALKVSRAEVWACTIEDRVGGAAEKLEALSAGGANLEMVLARRTEQPGQGVMFVTPVKGAKAVKAAQATGFGKPQNIHSVRIEGGDKPGLGAKISRALGNAGVSFRGVSACAIGRKFVSYIACDSAEDAARAVAALKKLR
jgi:predicted amino acid-binding ACT domain protein